MLTDEEVEQVKAGNYKVAICYHQLDNQVNQSKLQATLDVFKELNIEAVCTTDAQSDANKEVNDLENALSLNPDLLLSMPYDVEVTKAAYQPVSYTHLDVYKRQILFCWIPKPAGMIPCSRAMMKSVMCWS